MILIERHKMPVKKCQWCCLHAIESNVDLSLKFYLWHLFIRKYERRLGNQSFGQCFKFLIKPMVYTATLVAQPQITFYQVWNWISSDTFHHHTTKNVSTPTWNGNVKAIYFLSGNVSFCVEAPGTCSKQIWIGCISITRKVQLNWFVQCWKKGLNYIPSK